jgi:aminobenzoyl-glutamate utilization protein A
VNFEEMVGLRRDFHQHAEPAFLEIRTSSLITARLSELGIGVRRGGEAMRIDGVVAYPGEEIRQQTLARAIATGADPELATQAAADGTAVVAEIEGNRPGPNWAIRCDIDALPLTEATDGDHVPAARGFACATGSMHACGHDGNAVIGLALADRLADRDFPGRVRILFQPAEEGGRGAAAMIAAGAVADVDRFVAVHLGFGAPVGSVFGGCVGLLATNKLRATFTGEAAHAAAAPELGRNALVGAATAVLNVMALPRYSTADTRVNVGTLHAGDNVNIVPAHAELCEQLTERVLTVVRGAAAMHSLAADIERTGGSATMRCDQQLIDAIVDIATARYGAERVTPVRSGGGSDDASLFARDVQRRGGLATYMAVGGGNRAPHHNPYFDIDERAMPVAVDVIDRLIRRP